MTGPPVTSFEIRETLIVFTTSRSGGGCVRGERRFPLRDFNHPPAGGQDT